MKTTLYITATPIGSFKDISAHAITVLTNADLIVCEDTRSTQNLLNLLCVKNHKLESLHAQNEKEKSLRLIQKILEQELKTVVLVSDAGTPAISDPGAIFIALAHSNGLQVRSVPGPSSFVCALAASGFCHPRHVFSGFLSRNQKKQKEEFARWAALAPCVGIFFESPQRIVNTLKNLNDFFHPSTLLCLSREISKKFEENVVITLQAACEFLEAKKEILGEFVVCVEVLPSTLKSTEKKLNNTLKEECKFMAQKYDLNAKDLYSFIVKKHATNQTEHDG